MNNRSKYSIFRPRWLLPILVSVLILVALFLFGCHGLFPRIWHSDRLESVYTDTWHQIAGARYQANNVTIVDIDEKSLNAYKNTPLAFWTPLLARAIAILRQNGAKVIGIDLLFSTSAEQWLRRFLSRKNDSVQQYDQPLREEFNKGSVVLVCTTLRGGIGEQDAIILPIVDFWLSLPEQNLEKYVAFSDLVTDQDGVIRRFHAQPLLNLPEEIASGNRPRYLFGVLLALHASNFSGVVKKRVEEMQMQAETIAFAGPPTWKQNTTFTKFSFADLLKWHEAGQLPEWVVQQIKNRIVIIGSGYAGLNDNHITPYGTGLWGGNSGQTYWMTGPEIQANIAETLLSDQRIKEIPHSWYWPIVVLGLLFSTFAARYWDTTPSLICVFLLLIGSTLLSYQLFTDFYFFPTFSVQLTMLAAYSLVYSLRFVGETRTRKQIEQVFGRYTSKAVVSQLVDGGQMPELGGEAVEVSVLFSDIRNFTSLSEKLSPQRVIEMINIYLGHASQVVLDMGGNIDKFIGDAIMVEFGAPIRRADHPRCAIKAALGLRDTAKKFRPWFREHFPELLENDFSIGVGIHSGIATMGNIGSATRTEYTALGDTVNVASRLEGVTKEMKCDIVASEETIRAAGHGVITGKCRSLLVKGREQPIMVYEIIDLVET